MKNIEIKKPKKIFTTISGKGKKLSEKELVKAKNILKKIKKNYDKNN